MRIACVVVAVKLLTASLLFAGVAVYHPAPSSASLAGVASWSATFDDSALLSATQVADRRAWAVQGDLDQHAVGQL
jgi:hypothetical protein